MAITMTNVKNLSSVVLYSRQDDAIDEEASNWDEYTEDPILNQSSLVFKEGKKPTSFLFNFDFDGKTQSKIQDVAFGGMDDEKKPKTNLGSYGYNVVRHGLKKIENPEGVSDTIGLKFESGNLVSKNTMDKLYRAKLIGEFFAYYLTLTADKKDEELEIKN